MYYNGLMSLRPLTVLLISADLEDRWVLISPHLHPDWYECGVGATAVHHVHPELVHALLSPV